MTLDELRFSMSRRRLSFSTVRTFAAEPQAISARRGEGHRLERAELRPRTQRLLLRPGAVETELPGADKIGTESLRIELAVRVELRDSDREPHGPIVSAGQPGTSERKARPMLRQPPLLCPVNADGSAVTEIGTAVYVVSTDAPEADGALDPQAVVLDRDPGRPGPGLQLHAGDAEQYQRT